MNQTFEATSGESLLALALRHDLPICHACGGFCACTTCQVEVIAGAENLSPMMDDELERLETTAEAPTERSRLACQSLVEGDVTVMIVNLE